MSRIFITGSTDGLGLAAAKLLVAEGHTVALHARDAKRAADARSEIDGADDVAVGDLATIAGMRTVAEQANAMGTFDAVIHNAAVGYREPRIETGDGLEHVFAINVLAPYTLTMLMTRPSRLVYLTSGMHLGGDADLADPQWKRRRWNSAQAYSDSKLFVVAVAFAFARRWPEALVNAVDPGWAATRMGGPGAPGDLPPAARTQAWLATSDDPAATVTGECFYHQRARAVNPAARDHDLQDELLAYCAPYAGVTAR